MHKNDESGIKLITYTVHIFFAVSAIKFHKLTYDIGIIDMLCCYAVIPTNDIRVGHHLYYSVKNIFVSPVKERNIVFVKSLQRRLNNNGITSVAQHGIHADTACGAYVNAVLFKDFVNRFQIIQ